MEIKNSIRPKDIINFGLTYELFTMVGAIETETNQIDNWKGRLLYLATLIRKGDKYEKTIDRNGSNMLFDFSCGSFLWL